MLTKTLKTRETALTRVEEKITALSERNAHLEADVQVSRTNIEKRVEELNAALQRERMERAVVEGALEAARKDNWACRASGGAALDTAAWATARSSAGRAGTGGRAGPRNRKLRAPDSAPAASKATKTFIEVPERGAQAPRFFFAADASARLRASAEGDHRCRNRL